MITADFRRPAGPLLTGFVLVAAALLRGNADAGPFSPLATAVLGMLATAPVIVIRRFPMAAITAMVTANAVFVAFGRMSWSVGAVAGWLVALAAAPVLLPQRRAVAVVAAAEVAVLLGAAGLNGNLTPWDATAAEALAVLAAWGAGEMLRARRQSAREQAAAARHVRDLSERSAAARERAAIARELHDVVAHHVSLIAVRAATAPFAVRGLTGAGEAAFAEIAEEARAALTELRLVLGVLRAPDGAAETAPQPRLADLSTLLERVRAAGADVTLAVTGQPEALPAAAELCAFRVVQEALTNAGRHAPRCEIRVGLEYRPDRLSLRITNGPGRANGPAGTAGQSPGYGLAGLAERVDALGGSFQAGAAGGGFEVTAVLPLPLAAVGSPATAPPAGGQH